MDYHWKFDREFTLKEKIAFFLFATKSKLRMIFIGVQILYILLTLIAFLRNDSILFYSICLLIVTISHYFAVYRRPMKKYNIAIKENKKYKVEINSDGIVYKGCVQTKEIAEWCKIGNLDTLILISFKKDEQHYFLLIPINKDDAKSLFPYLDSIVNPDQPKIFTKNS